MKLILSEPRNNGSLVSKVFGPYRADALYLLPVYLRLQPVDLMVEFTGGRRLRVTTFGSDISPSVKSLKLMQPNGNGPTDLALALYLKREFPGF